MNIKIEDNFGNSTIKTIERFVMDTLDGEDYERGRLEEISATADNATKAIGRLCDVLISKEIISVNQLRYIATGSKNIDEKFTLTK